MGCAWFVILSAAVIVATPNTTSGSAPHGPILIVGDAGFTAANGVVQGSGSQIDPYVIDGWFVNASSSDGIVVMDTTAFFVIRNVTVVDGTWSQTCVRVFNSTHATVENITVISGGWGLRIEDCDHAIARGVSANDCMDGIALYSSDYCVLIENNLTDNWRGVSTSSSANVSFFSNSFHNDGISIMGDPIQDELYLTSHTIPANNTLNGRPIAYYTYETGLTLDAVDLGELLVYYSTDVRVSNTTMSNATYAISIEHCEDVSVENCTFLDAGTGLLCADSVNVSAVHNTCIDGYGYSLEFGACTNLLVHGNNISGGESDGIDVWSGSNCTISSNRIVNDVVWRGININADHVNVTNNSLINCSIEGYSLALKDVEILPDNSVNGLPILFYKNQDGIVVDSVPVGQLLVSYCTNMTVTNISVSRVLCGADFEAVSNLTLLNSSFTRNAMGVEVADSRDCILSNLDLTDNDMYGALIQHSSRCAVSRSNISNNSVGLDLWFDDNIRVVGNNFMRNAIQALVDYSSDISWDAGYPIGGNYWSDYVGIDLMMGPGQNITGSDGIGDTPYAIGTTAEDQYPLLTPLHESAPPIASAGPDLSASPGDTVEFNASSSHDDELIINYTWTFEYNGERFTLYGATQEFAFMIPGEYNVTLVVMDSSRQTSSDTVLVSVEAVVPEFQSVTAVVLLMTLVFAVYRATRKC